MDKITEMAMFVQVVDDGSFSAAGRALELAPSTVSKQVSRLEERLGARLLSRSTRRLSVTEAGRAFYDRCVAILAEIEDAERVVDDLSGVPRGTLRINGTVGFCKSQLIPRMPHFLAQYPDIRVEVTLSDEIVDVVAEGVDVALRIGALEDSSLVARKLVSNRRVICAAPSYIERWGRPIAPEELSKHNCLVLSSSKSFNQWEFVGPDGELVVRVQGNFAVNHADALYQTVLAGGGIARLATWLVGDDIATGRLVQLLPEYEHDRTAIYVVYPHRRHMSAKVRVFIDFLCEQFAFAADDDTESRPST